VFWQVTLGDQGVPVGWVLGTCERVGDGKGKARSVGDRASFSSLELGPHLVHFWKSGGLEVVAPGGVSLSTNIRDPRLATGPQNEAILGNLPVHWLASHC